MVTQQCWLLVSDPKEEEFIWQHVIQCINTDADFERAMKKKHVCFVKNDEKLCCHYNINRSWFVLDIAKCTPSLMEQFQRDFPRYELFVDNKRVLKEDVARNILFEQENKQMPYMALFTQSVFAVPCMLAQTFVSKEMHVVERSKKKSLTIQVYTNNNGIPTRYVFSKEMRVIRLNSTGDGVTEGLISYNLQTKLAHPEIMLQIDFSATGKKYNTHTNMLTF